MWVDHSRHHLGRGDLQGFSDLSNCAQTRDTTPTLDPGSCHMGNAGRPGQLGLGQGVTDPKLSDSFPNSQPTTLISNLPDYNTAEYVGQAFFAGAPDAGDQLRGAVKAQIDAVILEQMHGTVSFRCELGEYQPITGKVIDFRGKEVMRVVPR